MMSRSLALVALASLTLSAAPAAARGGRQQGPPSFALEACEGLAADAACSMETPRGTVEGTCVQTPRGDALACRPADGMRGRRGRQQGPPPFALEACEGLAADAACSMETPRGTVEGTCVQPPQGDALACRPADGRRGRRQGPPAFALEACEGLAADAACSMETPRGTVEGTCVQPPQGDALACRPADGLRGKGRHGRRQGPPAFALEACEGLAADAACSMETPRGTVEGTCQACPKSGELACRP